ncbi:SRPBCC family protein [Streptantibioticus ferralitis]|uniref:SRPBCC family protein n=1 Tax=Streptantibioticus ferralitis TaxID=236510 RepID=A0ABT5YY39_9ACTN|nr:SRPBCC family protein [Streptantibioticus ferralitis]MDF2256322.1 SRPBCC family protein [Streptantibioticus ferralitis]
MARRLRPVGLDFITSAQVRQVFAAGIAAEPPAVYQALAADTEGWTAWYRAVVSARPTDGGREIGLMGGVRFTETVLAAEQDERYVYRVDETNVPGVDALAEEWRITPLSSGGTRVQWTFAADAPASVRVLLRYARPGLGHAFRDAVHTLDRRLTTMRSTA